MRVYLKNQFGPGNAGQPVYRASFQRDFHVSKSRCPRSQPGTPTRVGCDNGLQGAAVIMQQDARARVNVLSGSLRAGGHDHGLREVPGYDPDSRT